MVVSEVPLSKFVDWFQDHMATALAFELSRFNILQFRLMDKLPLLRQSSEELRYV